MKRILAIGLSLLSLAVVSCRRGELDSARPADEVKFSVAMNSFDVKATDSAFETGDAVGIFAGDPISATNVKATVSGTSLTPETALYWVENQTSSTRFSAYLPYEASLSSSTTTFAVKPDQTAYADYQASDLMVATAISTPRTTVTFALKHQLSKLIVVPTCEDAAETVTSVTVQELISEATADLNAGTVQAGSAKNAIKAGAAVTGNGGQGFVAILVPQNIQLKLTLATSTGRTLEYSLLEAKTLESGKAYKADITVKAPGVEPGPATEVEFTISIVDWESAEDLKFYDPDEAVNPNEGKWSVIGLGGDWETDVWMTETSEGVWEADITYAEGDSFKLRQDGMWSSETETHAEAGMPAEAEGYVPADGSEYGLWGSNNKDIVLAQAGEYHIKFVTDGYKFYVTSNAEPEPGPLDISELYLLGAATDTGWALDAMAQFTKEGDVFTITANLKPNEKFRFPLQKESNVWWPCVVAGETEGSIQIGDGDSYDDNQFTVSEDGSYTIVVDPAAATVTFTRVGDRVTEAVEITELYLLGGATEAGWSLDAMPALTKDGNVFTITAHLAAGTIGTNEVFRFPMQKEANVWWPCIVKGDTDGTVKVGTTDADQASQFTVDTSGTYLITIDVAAMTYSIVLQEAD